MNQTAEKKRKKTEKSGASRATGAGKGSPKRGGAGVNQDELKRSFHTLRSYVETLETENRRLEQDLIEKRKARKQRLKEMDLFKKGSGMKLSEMKKRIKESRTLLDQYQGSLQLLQSRYRENARALKLMGERLARMESSASGPTPESPESCRLELISMMRELNEMKAKRKKLDADFTDLARKIG